jgi:1-aminocyclopropane-1-carboxylate synthase
LSPEQALQHVSPRNVALGSGCAALLNYIFFILGEENDACLIPSPYYAAFENDMNVRARMRYLPSCYANKMNSNCIASSMLLQVIAGCVPFAIHMANPARGPTENELDIAYVQATSVSLARRGGCFYHWRRGAHTNLSLSAQKGLRVKFVLLTNPNNPLGVIYHPDVIRGAIRWARKRNMHTIVDEIYALSTHKVRRKRMTYDTYGLLDSLLTSSTFSKFSSEVRSWIRVGNPHYGQQLG